MLPRRKDSTSDNCSHSMKTLSGGGPVTVEGTDQPSAGPFSEAFLLSCQMASALVPFPSCLQVPRATRKSEPEPPTTSTAGWAMTRKGRSRPSTGSK